MCPAVVGVSGDEGVVFGGLAFVVKLSGDGGVVNGGLTGPEEITQFAEIFLLLAAAEF